MNEQQLVVRCECGWETVGVEAEVVTATQAHGADVHNMQASRDEVLAMSTTIEPSD